jgi:hypothetical protein
MKGEHKPGYRPPRTGEKRAVRQPLKIDKLAQEVRNAILKARADGKTWEETAEAASKWNGEKLAPSVVHRWYDLRVAQVQREVMNQAEWSRVLAARFADKGIEKLPEAIQNALASTVFSLAELQDERSRQQFMAGMIRLADLQARGRELDQEDKRVALESKKVDQEDKRLELESKKVDAILAKVQGLKGDVQKKKLNSEELAKKLDEIYDIGRQAA